MSSAGLLGSREDVELAETPGSEEPIARALPRTPAGLAVAWPQAQLFVQGVVHCSRVVLKFSLHVYRTRVCMEP